MKATIQTKRPPETMSGVSGKGSGKSESMPGVTEAGSGTSETMPGVAGVGSGTSGAYWKKKYPPQGKK